ncbi:MAG: hypothetical protein GWN87_14990, partial [Desulfuromonadales bacterium]|nr:hypothetical protein [Desulfuromonadales bacterium]
DLDWHQLKQAKPHIEQLDVLCQELEFNTLRKRLLEKAATLTGEEVALDQKPKEDLAASTDGELEFDFGSYDTTRQYTPADVDYAIV